MQGDGIASLSFNNSVQEIFEEACRDYPTVRAFAIHDDFTIVGHYDNVIKVFDEFCRLATPEGIILQPSKSQIIWPETRSDPPPSSLQSLASSRQLPIVRSAVLLGSLIGATNSNFFMDLRRDCGVKHILQCSSSRDHEKADHTSTPSQPSPTFPLSPSHQLSHQLTRCLPINLCQHSRSHCPSRWHQARRTDLPSSYASLTATFCRWSLHSRPHSSRNRSLARLHHHCHP